MKAYKGFNKDLQCTPGGKVFQYAIGETYEKPVAKLCEHGFHACEAPLNVWDYYPPVDGNRFCEVELDGVSDERSNDTKVTAKKITVGAELGIPGLVKAHVEWVKEQVKTGDDTAESASGDGAQIGSSGYGAQIGSSGYGAKIGSSGDWAKIGSSGDGAQIGSSGDGAKIGSSGYNSVIMCAGNGGVVKAKVGSWFTLSEWGTVDGMYKPVCVKTAYVDGETIKADTWYRLKDGKFVEVDEREE